MTAAAPPVHDLVLNIRSFDSLARTVWGNVPILVKIDGTLVKIDRDRSKPKPLAKEIRTLEQQGSQALRMLEPGGSALAKDARQSLKTNLQLFSHVLKRISG